MAEETDSESDSKEEGIDKNEESEGEDSEEVETEESNGEEEEAAPIDYTPKLGIEKEKEPVNPFIERNIKNAINYLDGKSRSVVISALTIFIISIFNFIAWNFTELEALKYVGTILAIFLLMACGLGILISFNIHNVDTKKNDDVRTSGIILSIGSIYRCQEYPFVTIREQHDRCGQCHRDGRTILAPGTCISIDLYALVLTTLTTQPGKYHCLVGAATERLSHTEEYHAEIQQIHVRRIPEGRERHDVSPKRQDHRESSADDIGHGPGRDLK